MLTGLMLDLSGCSPPKFFARVSSRILGILLRMHFVLSFSMSFTTFHVFRNYACLISLVTVDVLSCCLQCCGFWVLKEKKNSFLSCLMNSYYHCSNKSHFHSTETAEVLHSP
jgi:hypothetical protein